MMSESHIQVTVPNAKARLVTQISSVPVLPPYIVTLHLHQSFTSTYLLPNLVPCILYSTSSPTIPSSSPPKENFSYIVLLAADQQD